MSKGDVVVGLMVAFLVGMLVGTVWISVEMVRACDPPRAAWYTECVRTFPDKKRGPKACASAADAMFCYFRTPQKDATP